MSNMVRAAVQLGPGKIEIQEFPRPKISADDALLKVEANAICGSDVETYRGHMGGNRGPFVPGHEPMGIIEEIGDLAAERWGVQEGDRVALEVVVPCRACRDCLTGRYQSCPFRKYGHGVTGVEVAPTLWGGFAEYMYISPTSVVHKIDKSLPVALAAMYNPLGAGVRWAVDLGGVKMGDTLVILGAGQRGLAAVAAAKAVGAANVIITGLERDQHKLAVAKELGADHTVVVDGDNAVDVVEFVGDITGGQMADVAVEMTPMAAAPITDSLKSVRHGGTVVLAGLKGQAEIPLNTDLIINRAITVKGAFGVDALANKKAIHLLESRRFPLEKMHTHSFGLDQVVDAIETLGGDREDQTAIHVTVEPNS